MASVRIKYRQDHAAGSIMFDSCDFEGMSEKDIREEIISAAWDHASSNVQVSIINIDEAVAALKATS